MMDWGLVMIIAACAMAASFIQRVSGFGFGIFMMTILPYLMPSFGESTALSGMLACVTALLPALKFRRHTPVHKLWIILTTFIVVSFFAVMLVSRVDSHLMKRILGGVLLAVSVYLYFFSEKVHIRPSATMQVSMGGISGIMGGLFGMQGPPAVIYFAGCSKDKDEYIALTQWYFLIGNVMMTFFRAGNGFVTAGVWKASAVAVIGVLAGLWLGARVYKRINHESLRHVIYGYMGIAGLVAIIIG